MRGVVQCLTCFQLYNYQSRCNIKGAAIGFNLFFALRVHHVDIDVVVGDRKRLGDVRTGPLIFHVTMVMNHSSNGEALNTKHVLSKINC